MSSLSLNFSRKRLHSPDFRDSSDSDDSPPPVKFKRKVSAARANFPDAVSAQLRRILLWCQALPVTGFFTMALKTGASYPEEIIVDDDDDDIPIAKHEARHDVYLKRIEQAHKQLLNQQRQRREYELKNESQQQRYPTRSSEITCAFDSRFESSHKSNGSSLRTRSYGSNGQTLRPLPTDSCGPITNPSTDIEILLDGESEKPAAVEADEIEIISESKTGAKPIVPPPRPTRRSVTKSVSSQPGSSRSTHSRIRPSKSYTAHEVVRLQERDQYRRLLEKYISGNQYQNTSKKKSSDVEDISGLDITGAPFKHEVLDQEVSKYIDMHFRPCQQATAENATKPQEKQIEEITIDDDDVELEIVEVLPKYKPKYQDDVQFFSPKWLAELKRTVNEQQEECLKKVEKQQEEVEKMKKKRMLDKLSLDVKLDSRDAELPVITPEMDEQIDAALIGDPKECICKVNGANVHRKDFETLDGLCWLNDLIINSYFDLIVARSKGDNYPSVYAYNTFFYTSFKCRGYAAVKRWTRKTDIFSYDLNFIPLHLGVHWALGVIDHRTKKVRYYDSMGDSEEKCLDKLHEYICLEHKDKKGTDLEVPYTTEIMKDIPRQMNGSDCGMFTLKYAEYISRDAEITFSQKDMAHFRRLMVYELLSNTIIIN